MNCIQANHPAPCGQPKPKNKEGKHQVIGRPIPKPKKLMNKKDLRRITVQESSEQEHQEEDSEEFVDLMLQSEIIKSNEHQKKETGPMASSQHITTGDHSLQKKSSGSASKILDREFSDIPSERLEIDKNIGEVDRKVQADRDNIGKSSAKPSTQMSMTSELLFEKNLDLTRNYQGGHNEEDDDVVRQMKNPEITESMLVPEDDPGHTESFSMFFEVNQRKKRSSTDPAAFSQIKRGLEFEEEKEEQLTLDNKQSAVALKNKQSNIHPLPATGPLEVAHPPSGKSGDRPQASAALEGGDPRNDTDFSNSRVKQLKDLESKYAQGQILHTYATPHKLEKRSPFLAEQQQQLQKKKTEQVNPEQVAGAKSLEFKQVLSPQNCKTITMIDLNTKSAMAKSQQQPQAKLHQQQAMVVKSGALLYHQKDLHQEQQHKQPQGSHPPSSTSSGFAPLMSEQQRKKKNSLWALFGSSKKKNQKMAQQQSKMENQVLRNRQVSFKSIDLDKQNSHQEKKESDSFISVDCEGIQPPQQMTIAMRKSMSANVSKGDFPAETHTSNNNDDDASEERSENSTIIVRKLDDEKEDSNNQVIQKSVEVQQVNEQKQSINREPSFFKQLGDINDERDLRSSTMKHQPKANSSNSKHVHRMTVQHNAPIEEEEDLVEVSMRSIPAGKTITMDSTEHFKAADDGEAKNPKKKEGMIKKFWVSSGLNAAAFSMQFKLLQGDKVKYDSAAFFPIYLYGFEFNPVAKNIMHQEIPAILREEKVKVKKQLFKSIIWCTYRKGFSVPLLCDERFLKFKKIHPEFRKVPEEEFSSDMNWGCTIRVGQMLICNTLLRHLISSKEKGLPSKMKQDLYSDDQLKQYIHREYYQKNHNEIYMALLSLVRDNDLFTLNKEVSCFSLPYVAKMGLITQGINPGTWYGVSSLSHVLRKLNSTFRPLSDSFQICVFNDGALFFEKIVKKMLKKVSIKYDQHKNYNHIADEEDRSRKMKQQRLLLDLFQDELTSLDEQGFGPKQENQMMKQPNQLTLLSKTGTSNSNSQTKMPLRLLRHPQEEDDDEWEDLSHQLDGQLKQHYAKFRNSCLVIIPCRLGMTKVDPDVIPSIEFIFKQKRILMGAMGGKPGQALYFVGLQKLDLIFLDPHLVQDVPGSKQDPSRPRSPLTPNLKKEKTLNSKNLGDKHHLGDRHHGDKHLGDEWEDPSQQRRPRSSSIGGFQVIDEKKRRLQEESKGEISPSDLETYHCTQTRKIAISKIDTTIAFAFYLDSEADFDQLAQMMRKGKQLFPQSFPISMMDTKWLENFQQQPLRTSKVSEEGKQKKKSFWRRSLK